MKYTVFFGLLLAALLSPAWGTMAARAALNRYAGANYCEIGETEEELDAARLLPTSGISKVTAAQRGPAAFLLLAPNPSTGHVRVGYGLPGAAKFVVLRLYDEWGQPAGEYALTDEALEAGVTLRLRAGIYHCMLLADGAVVAKERLLITTP